MKPLQAHCSCGEPVRALGQRYCKGCHNAAMRKHRKLGRVKPEQMARANVRSIAGVYKRRGLIDQCPCVLCGDAKSEMHHPDYSKPLEVVWLCRAHHLDLHAGRVALLEYPDPPPEIETPEQEGRLASGFSAYWASKKLIDAA